MSIKIKIPVAKPRNRLALAGRLRRAGSHEGEQPARRARRAEKHSLHLLLSGRKTGREEDS
ncbi:hypothetical protein [Janthinobacterium fluminis]|uniref:Uncharacterized protein n=1 Tax=Janthinobacterium fluminis TaxID=2987524 RepID=A0ABT5K6Y6_9BURK|nr:hypothetical protein [Janthinobacterium fluminis]MDC8760195.1 hypothetical protein [Janthinobacterium fluminis]